MKNTLVFLKQPRFDTSSLLKNHFWGEKKSNKQDRNKKFKQILPQSYFLKMLKFDPFMGFLNFQNQFFLLFFGFPSKKFFF